MLYRYGNINNLSYQGSPLLGIEILNDLSVIFSTENITVTYE